MQRKRALDADAEGLLSNREGLAHARALTLDDGAFEDLRTAPVALDDLEVNLHAIARLKVGNLAQLGPLEAVDDSAHCKKKARRPRRPHARRAMVAKGSDRTGARNGPPASAPRLPLGQSFAALRASPGRDSSVIARQQHVRHAVTAPVDRPRV